MLELVKKLLDMNQLEAGGMEFRSTELDILPMVEGVVRQFESQAAAKHITIHYPSEFASCRVIADEQAMEQVLDNLLSNAVKYSPHGKHVFVRVLGSESKLRLEVQDEGPGISESDHAKLFEKFSRLSARPTGGEHSTGLGLSIVKKMVEAMNGRVWCESKLGKGTTFIVELPAA
jgi:signal transduction histidine kinase